MSEDMDTLLDEIKATEQSCITPQGVPREEDSRASCALRHVTKLMLDDREEMKGLGYQSSFISWRNVGSLA